MSQSSAHQSSIIITPPMLKQQILIRLYTLLGKVDGKYYPEDESGFTIPLTIIEGMEIHGLETRDREVYLMAVPTDDVESVNVETENGMIPYNAKEFYLEQLWEVYVACEPIYISRFNDYGTFQDN